MTKSFLIIACLIALGQNFDRLSDSDRQLMQQRFEKEIWPLMTRGGKDGCVGCHSGKAVTALRLSGDVSKDFGRLVREGFFIPGDAGSLLERVTDPDKKRRMPLDRSAWSEAEVKVLRAFVADLDRKQK
jgi:hypothetical protein